ncbi:tetratricopeptide repeat protein [Candidatus Magnetaquicoccus inordinatus]|uniref:tetratricopeptide repeat protein n=1 Tax=Candidatus Magnetaquicoccus inordinatus TaxID=2496818 RepID=UPI00102BB871|nr:tetratricopeptide repeat protein [Candidatus Magnetaquicoccus inordinatus]
MKGRSGRALWICIVYCVLGMGLSGCVSAPERNLPTARSLPDAGAGKNAALRVQKGLQEAEAGRWEEALNYFSDALNYHDLTVLERAIILNNRGVMQQRMGIYDGAITDFSAAIKMRSDLPGSNMSSRALFNRGIMYYLLGEYQSAVNDLEQYSKSNKAQQRSPYAVLWHYLAQERSGVSGRYELVSSCRRLWREEECERKSGEFAHLSWPGPLFALHLEQLSAEEVVGRVPRGQTERQSKEYLCDIYFHLGEYYSIRGEQGQARYWWQMALETGMTHLSEYTGSQMGIQRNSLFTMF